MLTLNLGHTASSSDIVTFLETSRVPHCKQDQLNSSLRQYVQEFLDILKSNSFLLSANDPRPSASSVARSHSAYLMWWKCVSV